MSDDNPTLPYPDTSIEHPTLVIPGDNDEQDAESPPKPRRWPWILLIVIVVLAVLAVAAELIVRSILPGVVRGIVIEQLDLPKEQQLDVNAEGILIPQLLAGSLDRLNLSTTSVTIGGITGAADVTAQRVSLRGDDLAAASGTVRIDQTQFETLVSESALPVDSIAFVAPNITTSGKATLFGFSVPIELTATPGVSEGELTLTPVRLVAAGVEVDAAQVAAQFGGLGERLTQPQRICIADRLPAGITLTGLSIEGSAAVIDLSVDGRIVSDERLRRRGTCE